jgi:flavin-binding protein dodecin
MSVEKALDLTATAPSIEEAVAQAIHRASLTLQGLTTFEVKSINGNVVDGEPMFRVEVRVNFIIKERLHE